MEGTDPEQDPAEANSPARRAYDSGSWLAPESLIAQEAREVESVNAGTFDGRGHAGSIYAFAAGINREFLRGHALLDDADTAAYASLLAAFLSLHELRMRGAILDVGCAIGAVTDALAAVNRGGRTFGIDLSRHGIEYARKRYPRCEFLYGSADSLKSVADGTLNVIHARQFYPFNRTGDPRIPLRFLDEFARKLAPGGAIVISANTTDGGAADSLEKLVAARPQMGMRVREPHAVLPLRLAKAVPASLHCAAQALFHHFGAPVLRWSRRSFYNFHLLVKDAEVDGKATDPLTQNVD